VARVDDPNNFDDRIEALEAGRAPRMEAAITSAITTWQRAKTLAAGS
jgi:hypothetical protein